MYNFFRRSEDTETVMTDITETNDVKSDKTSTKTTARSPKSQKSSTTKKTSAVAHRSQKQKSIREALNFLKDQEPDKYHMLKRALRASNPIANGNTSDHDSGKIT